MTDELTVNKETAVRFLDAVSAGDIDTLLALTTPDWQMHGGPPDLPRGPDGIRALFASIGPVDQIWTVDDVIAERDRVVVRATNTCEQESFFGIPAAGVRQVFTATFTFRLDDGRIAETWRNADDLGRLLQLGATFTAPTR
jgi:ketosteroid isomerase-like protein